jgi:hypothetical protein
MIYLWNLKFSKYIRVKNDKLLTYAMTVSPPANELMNG